MSELYHHGVLGMRWGVRRYQPYSTNPRRSGKGGEEIGEAKQRAASEKKVYRSLAKKSKAEIRRQRAIKKYNRRKYKYSWRPDKGGRVRRLSRSTRALNRKTYKVNTHEKKYEELAREFEKTYGKKALNSISNATIEKYRTKAKNLEARNARLSAKYLKRGINISSYENAYLMGKSIESNKELTSRRYNG